MQVTSFLLLVNYVVGTEQKKTSFKLSGIKTPTKLVM